MSSPVQRWCLLTVLAVASLVAPPASLASTTAPQIVGSAANKTSLAGTVSVAVAGNYAYTTAYWPGQLTVLDVSGPGNPTIVGSTPANLGLQNGTNVTIAGGYAFVVSKNRNASTTSNDDTSGNSLTIVDIHTNPTSPTIVGSVHSGTQLFGAYGIAVSGHYAYVAYQGVLSSSGEPLSPDTSKGGFSVIDLSTLGSPTIVANIDNGSLPAPWTNQNVFRHATSVAISGNIAYVTAFDDARVTVVDISTPTSPKIVTSLRDATKLSFPADLAVQGNYVYVANQSGSASQQFTVLDVSNPSSPKVVAGLSNSLLAGAYRIRVQGSFAYVSAWGAATIAAIDISNPASPRIAGTVTDAALLTKTTGLDVDAAGRYVIATSPRLSGETFSAYPPFTFTTGTVSKIQLDPNPIAVTIATASEPPNPTSQTSANLSFSVNDDVSTVRCNLDGAPYGACTTQTSQQYSSLAPGAHTFTVQATDAAGTSSTDSYTWTVNAPPVAPQNTAPPSVSGTARLGSQLTASGGTWSGSPTPTLSFQWTRCDQQGQNCANIAGATNTAYTAVSADVGSTLVVVVTGTNVVNSSSASSTPTAVVSEPPSNTSPPAISGSAQLGSQLTASGGVWSGSPTPTLSFQWTRCDQSGQGCATISGATSTTYTAQSADVGSTLVVVVTGTNVGGGSSASSSPTAVVAAPPSNKSRPVISGPAVQGQTLAGSNGVWSGYPTPGYTDRWWLCDSTGSHCVSTGDTTPRYLLTAGDVGHRLRFVVTGANNVGSTAGVSLPSELVRGFNATSWKSVLTGAATGHPTLRITIPAAGGGLLVKKLVIALPNGLRFARSNRQLAQGVAVSDSRSKRLSFSRSVRGRSLALTLRGAASGIKLALGRPAVSPASLLATSARRKHGRAVAITVIVTVTDGASATTTASLSARGR